MGCGADQPVRRNRGHLRRADPRREVGPRRRAAEAARPSGRSPKRSPASAAVAGAGAHAPLPGFRAGDAARRRPW
ncbi:hypothetical protein D6T65_11465 [Arthrobacter frigidicola]|nr:hypothetical protein D6T65_11465 [Arthrobacter frigidicola]